MAFEPSPTAAHAPFPVRPRGVLEILDASIKLYRQYFWVLIGWSSVSNILSSIPYLNYILRPFITVLPAGAASCSIAAAVRGQKITFKQCWQFTKPRYWPLVGISLLSWIILCLCGGGILLICGLFFAAGYAVVSGSSEATQLVALFLGVLVIGFLASVLFTVLFIWFGMVQVVICMEERHRNASAMGRAYDLLRENWMRLTTLLALFGLGLLVLYGLISFGLWALGALPSIKDIAAGHNPGDSFLKDIVVMALTFVCINILWQPLYYLILNLLYLDIRTRKEALDLEWAAHTTAPEIDPSTYPSFTSVGYPDPAAFPTAAHVWTETGDMPAAQPSTVAPSQVATPNENAATQCPFCGAAIALDDIYCLSCGARVRNPV